MDLGYICLSIRESNTRTVSYTRCAKPEISK